MAKILIIIVLVLGIGVTGYLFFANQQGQKQLVTEHQNFPVYPQAVVKDSSGNQSVWQSDETVAEVDTWYRLALSQDGWVIFFNTHEEEAGQSDESGHDMIEAQKGQTKAYLVVHKDHDNPNKSEIILTTEPVSNTMETTAAQEANPVASDENSYLMGSEE